MSFLLYLHFAYHEYAEEISHALFDSQANEPAKLAVLDTMKLKSDPKTLSQPIIKVLKKRFNQNLNETNNIE